MERLESKKLNFKTNEVFYSKPVKELSVHFHWRNSG